MGIGPSGQILIGHSLGVRVLTRALFSSPLVPTKLTNSTDDIKKSDVDLVIGLEGAFSVRRFIHDKGIEGYPYERFKDYFSDGKYAGSARRRIRRVIENIKV